MEQMFVLYGRETKMLAERAVVLNLLGNDVEDPLPQPQICSQKHEKFLAIVGIYPHAVLNFDESVSLKKRPQTVAHASTPFPNIKYDDAPFAIPSFRLLYLEMFFFIL